MPAVLLFCPCASQGFLSAACVISPSSLALLAGQVPHRLLLPDKLQCEPRYGTILYTCSIVLPNLRGTTSDFEEVTLQRGRCDAIFCFSHLFAKYRTAHLQEIICMWWSWWSDDLSSSKSSVLWSTADLSIASHREVSPCAASPLFAGRAEEGRGESIK